MNLGRVIAVVTSLVAVAMTTVGAQRESRAAQRLTVFDRQGRVLAIVGEPGLYTQPAFSPDGTKVAVVKTDPATQHADVWVITVSTGAAAQVTSDSAANTEPTWSPDGKQLAFISRRNGVWGIYRAAANEHSTEELLYQHAGFGGISQLWWSRDGQSLAFSDLINISGALYVLDLGGGHRVREALRPPSFNARISPDARFIAYPFSTSGRTEMYIRRLDLSADLDVGAPARVGQQISNNGTVGMLHWRRDGREAYYLAPRLGVMAVDVSPAALSRLHPPRRLFSPPSTRAGLRLATVSPDGERFMFIEPPLPPLRQLTILDQDGATLARVGEPNSYGQPSFSPDGTKIAVVHADTETGNQDIWTLETADGAIHAVTADAAPDSAPVWSPDGREVAFVSTRGERTGIFRKAWNGRGEEELLYEHTAGTPGVVLTDWSSDGRLLTFFAGDTLYILPLDGSRRAIEFERTEFSSIGGRFSPDARFFAFLSDRTGRYELYVRPTFDGVGRLLSDAPATQLSNSGAMGVVSWQQNPNRIRYLSADGALVFVDVGLNMRPQRATPTLLFRPPRTNRAGPYAAIDNAAQAKNSLADGERYVFAVPVSVNSEAK
jgi:Tol biopolymer transport system component